MLVAMLLGALGATVIAEAVVLAVLAAARREPATLLGAALLVPLTGAPVYLAHTAAAALAWDSAPGPVWHPFVAVLALRVSALVGLAHWRGAARAERLVAGAAATLGTVGELAAWVALGPR